MAQNFQYTKISELPTTTSIDENSQIIVNVGNQTKIISFADLQNAILSEVNLALSSLIHRVENLEGTVQQLGPRVTTAEENISNNSDTISNIITAGFNLIDNEQSAKNN